MNSVVWVILGVVVLVLIGGVVSYNRFVRQRNLVQESWRRSTSSSPGGTT